MRDLFILICSLLFSTAAFSQKTFSLDASDVNNVAAINEWTTTVTRDYPRMDFAPVKIQENLFIVLNLFEDKYFVPVFGEKFTTLSGKKRSRIVKILDKCSADPAFSVSAKWLQFLSPLFSDEEKARFNYTGTVGNLAQAHETREKYDKTLAQARDINNPLPAGSCFFYQKNYRGEFKNMLPSEHRVLLSAIDTALIRNDNIRVTDVIAELIAKPASLEAMHAITGELSYQNNLGHAADTLKISLMTKLKDRVDAILPDLMKQEELVITQFPVGEAGFEARDKFSWRFTADYADVREKPIVNAVYAKYHDERKNAVKAFIGEIEKKYRAEKNVDMLDFYYRHYFVEFAQSGEFADQRKEIGNIRARAKDEADQAAAAERKRKLAIQGITDNFLNLEYLNYRNCIESAYLNDIEALKKIRETNPNEILLCFKMLLHALSDQCKDSWAGDTKKIDIKSTRYVRSEYLYFPRRRTDIYEEYVVKTVFIPKEYVQAYESVRISAGADIDAGNIWGVLADPMKMVARMEGILMEGNMASSDGFTLIASNGCSHPGIKTVLNNLKAFLDK